MRLQLVAGLAVRLRMRLADGLAVVRVQLADGLVAVRVQLADGLAARPGIDRGTGGQARD